MTVPNPPAPGQNPKRNKAKPWLIGIGVVVVVFVALAVLGAIVGPQDKDSKSAAPSSSAASPVPTTAPTTPPSSAAPAPTTTSAPAAAAPSSAPAPAAYSDPRCTAAPADTVALIEAGLTKSGQHLTNGTVITDGRLVFFGATTVDAAGKMAERSDVWILSNNVPYASTGGARNGSKFPKASAAPVNISPGDERVQAVDACVVKLTQG
ncbi:DUF2510 domain-containing protein [Nocardia sp. CA-145437]|uniref:DUF2510 domain-containing protein n=1 Tax=Nocardia sp. CA-145437 TaxID=3239980 RepID=UPI003D965A33